MDKLINLRMPHIGELMFESLDTNDLVQYLEVSQTWKVLAENVLLKRWKGKMFEACKTGKSEIVKLLLENYSCEENGLNAKNILGRTPFMVACLNGHTDVVKV